MKVILTEKRKDKLADYSLNISVASFAVAAFDGNWWGGASRLSFSCCIFLAYAGGLDMAIWLVISAVAVALGALAVYERKVKKT